MLYDNAQLALVYLHGWLVSSEAQFRKVCEETLDFLVREMNHPLGGFYSSLDADSEGEEGKFYVWTPDEIQVALDDPQDIALISAAYNITAAGNFEGRNVLQRTLNDEQLAVMFNLPVEVIPEWLVGLHARLFMARSKRVRPNTDDKVLVAWNALALAAFAEAGRYLGRGDYLTIAQRTARFLLENLIQDGRLLRSWRAGQAKHNAYLEDYAALILGLLAAAAIPHFVYSAEHRASECKANVALLNAVLDRIAAQIVCRDDDHFSGADHDKVLYGEPDWK
jgi:uncharacterized protein YyaL (SSP411 family)